MSTEQDMTSFAFTAENLEQAKKIIAKYPAGRQQSAVMPLLDLAQRQVGWTGIPVIEYIAEMLEMAPIRVQEVVTFYTMYNQKPVGQFHVQVCTNICCLLRGSDGVGETAREVLGVNWGDTTEDGKFTLVEVECLGACVNAPMMQINDDYYEDLTPESTKAVLEALKRGETPNPGPQGGRQFSAPEGGPTTLGDLTFGSEKA
ncbi:NADH-quinone oxidoreductase subunit NuoE [Magnetospirillum sulfuroxidans]|uniref:NADH-quinone oxidoreductase subunit NuoE n=1 Tax=Magnetospirillum sulfuroxidans TaxID=611300 RepID=A0ABS5I8J0_9PROT|nr:NADH-quinone oxidoreductase subunit NuoE [Magnetospirillum sulfuroxidans]MBR9970754.1 NADH-quinone oxidoreductase subunit NuoE [Magnetospirillum sulfuroxidans]